MRRLFYLLLFLVLLGAGALVLLPYILSAETIRDKVAQQIANWTGREITLAGPARLSVFPDLTVEIDEVAIANGPGLGDQPLITTERLSGSLKLLPLLSGTIQVDSFVMLRPRIHLVVGEDGRTSWDFTDAPAAQPADPATSAPATSEAPAEGTSPPPAHTDPRSGIPNIQIGSMVVEDGILSFENRRNGQSYTVTAIQARLAWPSIARPLSLEASAVWNGEVVNVNARIDDAVALASGASSQVEVKVASSRMNGTISGQANTAADLAINGNIDMAVPSVRALASWVGSPLPNGTGLDKLQIRSRLVAGGSKLSLSEARLELDGNAAEGAVTLLLAGDRPNVQGTLAFERLDLNPYLAGLTAKTTNGASPQATPAPTAPGAAPGAAPATTSAPAAAAAWSDAPMSFAGLKGANADLRLSAAKIVAMDLALGSGAMTVALKDGNLSTQIVGLQAYGGSIDGTIVVDARRSVPALATQMKAASVDLGALFRDFAGTTRLTGVGSLDVNLSATGASQQRLVSTLQGAAAIDARNGALQGVDFAKVIAAFQARNLADLAAARGGATQFQSLQASYRIASGIARNDDLRLESPSLRVTGQGTLDLPNQRLDYRVIAALRRQGGVAAGQSDEVLQVPFRVDGPWASPRVIPDAAGIVGGSQAIQDTVQGVTDALKQGDLKGAEDALKQRPQELIERGKQLLDGDNTQLKSLFDQLLGGGAKPQQ